MFVPMENNRNRIVGIGLIVASTAFVGLAGVFTKATSEDPWTIAGWRGFIGSILIGLYVLWRRQSKADGVPLRLGWRGWLLVTVGSLSSMCFIASLKYTYVTNVAVISATMPFMAAAMEWLILRERVKPSTMVSAAASLTGVVIIVSGGISAGDLLGNMVALLMTLGLTAYLVMVRAFRGTPVVWAAAVSAFVLFVACWFVVDPLATSMRDALLMSGFGVSFAASAILWNEGARLLPAAETSLLGTVEIPFAAFFAWLILAELPPLASILGGLIVVAAVLLHAGRDFAASYGKAAPVAVG
jgi:drug/metabolite transporter (DMT)-like permease